MGTTQRHPFVNNHKLYNLSGTSTIDVDGAQVASVCAGASCSPSQPNGTYLITTASSHSFHPGDTVACEYYSQTASQHWVSQVAAVPSSTSFAVSFGAGKFSAGANTFGFCGLLNAFIEDNSEHVVIQDIDAFQSHPAGFFSYVIVNDNDQQLHIERAANRASSVLKNTPNFPMGAFVLQRNDQGNDGITYVHDAEFTNINCVDAGGNGLVISDTVCQGFPVYGFRYFGGLQPATFENNYQESTGGTVNPLYGNHLAGAQMGILTQGGFGTKILGSFPIQGSWPFFATGGGASTQRNYWVVPHSSEGTGPMLFIGQAQPASPGAHITVQWPSVELQDQVGHGIAKLTWDVLMTTGSFSTGQVPYGTGKFALATGISGSCNTAGMCRYVDAQAQPATYTVPTQSTFIPVFWYWPSNFAINNTIIHLDGIGTNPGAVASQGILGVSIEADQCYSGGVASQLSPIWATCLAADGKAAPGYMATVLQQTDSSGNFQGGTTSSKGRLNFGKLGANGVFTIPFDWLTLADSNWQKTMATAGWRPQSDAADTAIGADQGGGLSERAAKSISSYIDAVPNGANYLERLTSSAKTFNIPVRITPVVFSTLSVCNSGAQGEMAAVTDSTTAVWGATITGGGNNHVLAYCDGSHWTVAAK